MSATGVDEAVESAISKEASAHTHDPRIDAMYKRDVITIYAFVVALWVVLWSVFFFVANRYIDDDLLRFVLILLGLFASVFNTVGMVQNIRRLRHERVRFYSQDLYWQDQKRAQKAA